MATQIGKTNTNCFTQIQQGNTNTNFDPQNFDYLKTLILKKIYLQKIEIKKYQNKVP